MVTYGLLVKELNLITFESMQALKIGNNSNIPEDTPALLILYTEGKLSLYKYSRASHKSI